MVDDGRRDFPPWDDHAWEQLARGHRQASRPAKASSTISNRVRMGRLSEYAASSFTRHHPARPSAGNADHGPRHAQPLPMSASNSASSWDPTVPMLNASPTAVHPRACGEHSNDGCQRVSYAGSSPRLRGTLQGGDRDAGALRFIPAPAGNTCRRAIGETASPVHPRACGEHVAKQMQAEVDAGSSPRLRGTRGSVRCWPWRHRFIPAPAGNTPDRCPAPRTAPVHPRACGEH